MHPILFRIGEFPIGSYALLALIGLTVTAATFSWLARRDGRDRMVFLEVLLWGFVVGLVAAKLFGAIVAFDAERPWASVGQVLRYGGHYYIGVLGSIIFFVVAFRRLKVPLPTGLDWLAPALALGHGIGRIGCFLAGCCWGEACSLPWAVTFTNPDASITGVPLGVALHPTQLYEAAAEILVGLFLLWKHLRHRGAPGTTFLWYVVLYGIVRFAIEFVRADPRGTFVGMPTSQPIAIASAVVAGCVLIVLARRRPAGPGGPDAAGKGKRQPA